MIASFPMYMRDETRDACHHLYANFRAAFKRGSQRLTETHKPEGHWIDPNLLISQTCGLPYRTKFVGSVRLVGSPDHRLDGCPPGYYRSVIVARADDHRDALAQMEDATFAFNARDSQSGWAAFWTEAQAIGVTVRPQVESGAHIASATAVAEGRADLASLDAVSWSMMQEWDDWTQDLKVIGQTRPTPALPFITGLQWDRTKVAAAMEQAIEELSDADKAVLRLFGLVQLPSATYLAVPTPRV